MFSSDNSGVFWTLLSLIVIVFVGIGVSELSQRRFEFSSSNKGDRLAIQNDAAHLAELTDEKDTLESRLIRAEKPSLEQSAEMAIIQGNIRKQQIMVDELKATVATRQSAFDRSKEGFVAYRTKIRNEAAGEKIPVLRIRSGRQYENASIIRVTPIGLVIDHAEGRARISSIDLDESWQQRFQWDEDERKAMLKEEEEQPPLDIVSPTRSSPVKTPTAESEVQRLRDELKGWNNKVSQLNAQHTEAKTNLAESASPSVPGSLETWAARASRLGGDLDRARTNQLRARAKLAMVSPNDLLLQLQP